ncbi:MAG: Slp family lipoprotein [Nitrospirae bacterium]|nr:Slp family lipoprotein [Nitrospirota bacterium]
MKIYSLRFITFFLFISLFSCEPVLRHDIMNTAIRDISFSDINKDPAQFKEKLFVLGGIIVDTKAMPEGSLIEAIYIPVDARGYLKGVSKLHNRFFALFPKENGLLDPLIFSRNREITIAGEFMELRQGKIDEMDYLYPLFIIKEIYLWPETRDYYLYPVYYEPFPYRWYYPYWWNGPYWRLRYPGLYYWW